jgi:hypothetical protein
MAYVPVVISGVSYPKNKKDPPQPVTIVGNAWIAGLMVDGGPVLPPAQPDTPPGVPAFPIWGPPGMDLPDKPGYPPVAGGGPIIPPESPPDIPTDPTTPKPPPPQGGWGWHPVYGWGYFPGSGGKPQPGGGG